MYHKVLNEKQKEYLRKLIIDEGIFEYDEICKRIGGPRPPIRLAIKQWFGPDRIRKCPYCGRERVLIGKNNHKKFCCEEHKKKYFNTHRKKTKLTICKNCGKEFYQYSFRNNVYCCCSCAAEHRGMVKREQKELKK